MPNLDDERFEAYLKQFQPLVPEPLPLKASAHRARRAIVLWAVGMATVAVLIGTVALHIHTERARIMETAGSVGTPVRLVSAQPLTTRSANAMMAKAPSYKALIDDMAFRSQTLPLPNGKRSAVAVLGKEKVKL